MSVVAFHAFPAFLPGGFVGVDVFFVISGFLITGILLKEHATGTFSVMRFYERRVRRLFPALSVVLVATVLAAFAFGYPSTIASTAKHGAAGAFSVTNVALWREAGYFDTGSHLKPLLHLWSLGVEEQFYLVWPLLLAAMVRVRGMLLVTVAGLCIASLVTAESMNVVHRGAVFFLPFSRVWELGTGAALAILVRDGWSSSRVVSARIAEVLGVVGVVAIIASALCLDSRSPFPGILAVPPVAGAALVIWAGSGRGQSGYFIQWSLASRPAVYIGAISYSLYLWHWPLLSLPAAADVELNLWTNAGLVGVAFVCAALTLRWIETPARRSIAPRRAALVSCLALFGASILCAAIYANTRWTDHTERAQLEQALDWPAPDAGQGTCPEEIGRMDPPLDYCRVSGAPPATAVVWGDSHADHLFLGVSRQDDHRSWMLLGNASCPPTVGIDVIADYPYCRERAEEALRWLEHQDLIKTVVLGFFGHYLDDVDVAYAHRNSAVGPSKVRIDGTFDRNRKARAFAHGLANSVERLAAVGKRVVLVIDVPELPFEPKHCFVQPRIRLAEQHCRVSASAVAFRQSAIRAIITDIAAMHPKTVAVADPTAVLCDLNFCAAGTAMAPTYRDSHHLSVHGSVIAAKVILQAERLLP
jgi:peptidoglycan/LPS O-acetylase OafA/YrhL